jgi:hypothetical protein
VIVDEGATFDASHPMHLHGHSFRVVSQKKVGKMTTVKEIQELDMAGIEDICHFTIVFLDYTLRFSDCS